MFMTLGLSTLDTPEKIAQYVRYGASEMFMGFVPDTWLQKYGWEVGPNRRTLGHLYNFTNASELRAVVEAVHDVGGTVNLAVNALENGVERMGYIHDMFDLFETLNPDAYIIADPAIMSCVKDWGIQRPIHLSTGVGCFNSEAVRFFCEQFHITRLVIPRKVTLREIRFLIDNLKDLHLEYEVMIISYRCYFNDENCHSIHSAKRGNCCGDVVGHQHAVVNLLPDNWKEVVQEGIDHPQELLKEGSIYDKFLKEWKKNLPPSYPDYEHSCSCCSQGLDPALTYAMMQNCGLCAIKPLRDMGVQALKVPLRGSLDTKLSIVKIVSDVMNAENPDMAYCRKIVNSPAYCDNKVNCYYDLTELEEKDGI